MTVSRMVVVDVPLALVAVMLYWVVLLNALGVPQIVPLLVPKLRPAGSEGEIDQLEGFPMIAPAASLIWPYVYSVPLEYRRYRLPLMLWRSPTLGMRNSPS